MERSEVLRLCGAKGKTILDIGAGPLARIAAKKFNCRVTSIDIDESKLKREKDQVEREELQHQIELRKMDAANLHLEDNSYQIIISYGALHHIPSEDREKFLSHAFRVASEKLCIADFRPSEFPHSKEEYLPVDLKWLGSALTKLGPTEKRVGRRMNLYICSIT